MIWPEKVFFPQKKAEEHRLQKKRALRPAVWCDELIDKGAIITGE
jgi:hypothetical protein